MAMLEWLSYWLSTDNTKLIYVLTLILCANVIDFMIGWINARFNKKMDFSSTKAIHGILRKMILMIVLIFFIPVALLVPEPVGISALYVLYIGYLLSEINSILSHLKITSDDKTGALFGDFIQTIFKGSGKG